MNAIEIRNLSKSFRGLYAVDHLNMTVPVGSIYGFIGENGSGKSTTEKLICGLLVPSGGSIKLYGRDYTDADVRAKIGVLIEAPGCFPDISVWNNMMIQAANLHLPNPKEEISKVLKMVCMEGAAGNKYKNCSLGMKQRIGIAMALLGDPALLILDEPINGEGSGISTNMLSMCNINLLFFLAAVLVCAFVSDDFKSGYAKNLFTVRARKTDCVISKTLVGFVGGALMILAYVLGAVVGGAIAGLSFDPGAAGVGGIVM